MRTSFLLLALLGTAACGGKIENTGTLHAEVAANPPPRGGGSGSGNGGGASATPPGTDPTRLVDGNFERLAVDDTSFYLAGEGGLVRLPKDGSAPEVLLAGDGFIEGLAVDASFLYWTRLVPGEIVRMPKTGGKPEVIATGQVRPWGIAVDADHVYWACQGDEVAGASDPPPGGQVASVPKAGGDVTVLAANLRTPVSVAVSGDWLYFGGSGWGDANGTVKRVPRAGGAVETLAERIAYMGDLVVTGEWVAWTSGDRLQQVKIGDPTVIDAVVQPNVMLLGTGLVTDGTSLYYGARLDAGGAILRTPLGGSTWTQHVASAAPSDATHFVGTAFVLDGGRMAWLDYWWTYAEAKNNTEIHFAAP